MKMTHLLALCALLGGFMQALGQPEDRTRGPRARRSGVVLQKHGTSYLGVGAADIDELRTDTRFVRITGGGLRESHPHNVTITREAPNYSL
mgnify:CR=1 FL=1